ncbi:MAG: hypothetical protein GY835_03840 [bacterium]|nr:hypothetical protein [bacterium]
MDHVCDPGDIEHPGNVLDRISDVVLSDCDHHNVSEHVRDLRDVLGGVSNSDAIFACASGLVSILDRIGDLDGVRDPGAIFFSDPRPSLWLTERLKR